MPSGKIATLKVPIWNLRTRIAYAIDLILDPDEAEEFKEDFYFDFQQELYDYETESEFDYGKDVRD